MVSESVGGEASVRADNAGPDECRLSAFAGRLEADSAAEQIPWSADLHLHGLVIRFEWTDLVDLDWWWRLCCELSLSYRLA